MAINYAVAERANSADFRSILKKQIPLLDVRAPIEFEKGAFNQSINQPLMNNEERAAVGVCYKNKGQDAAIALGNALVSGHSKTSRINQWQQFTQAHKEGYLYCFRGGLRSQTVQRWLAESGVNYPLLIGGYKGMRQFLMEELEQLALHPFYILAGNTGCGKTPFLTQCANSLDLEAAAAHRGSSFGAFVTPQSSQINFENKLAEQYIVADFSTEQPLILEDEGRLIGSVHLPDSLRNAMALAPIVVIEESFEHRLAHIYQEYIVNMTAQYTTAYTGEYAFIAFSHYLEQGLFKVRKRLGSQRYGELVALQAFALNKQKQGELHHHFAWLTLLLTEYYDPMYQYQLAQKNERIIFRGNKADCLAFFQVMDK